MKIAVVQRKDNKIAPERVFPLFDRINAGGAELIVPMNLCGFYSAYQGTMTFAPEGIEALSPDLIIVLGGDGSIISAAREFNSIPIIGFNFGNLAYMAELEITEEDMIDRLVRGDYEVEERIMLDASVHRGDSVIPMSGPAFNDLVLSNGPVPHIITFDLVLDGVRAQSYKSDGMIIATPSGSTAYSMSAGGPVLDPSLDCIVATPICPHSIGQRPVVLSSSVEIRLDRIEWRKDNVYLSADGNEVIVLQPGDVVRVCRSAEKAKLAHVKKSQFLTVLNEKMGEK